MPTSTIEHFSIAGLQHGQVVVCYSRRGFLDCGNGELREFVVKGKKLRVVCGDEVEWVHGESDSGAVVVAVRERRNALERVDSRGRTETLAANSDRLLVVLAAEPRPDFYLADRFLCAAELMHIASGLIWNKSDLGLPEPEELHYYRELGYPVHTVSALDGTGITGLESALASGITLLVGQSGAGKSSLLNQLVNAAAVPVGAISDATGEGRHTTTVAVMHQLTDGGKLIDSPGVREFTPRVETPADVQWGFRDVAERGTECRFSNCLHWREPGCAVKAAAESGRISPRRYESYRRILATTSKADGWHG